MVAFSALPSAGEGPDSERRFKGVSRILGPTWTRLPVINIGMLGVQIFWCVEMSYASPYLLTLGLSKSKMAIVFLAPPLSGLLVQPLIGILADSSTSSLGRRRPFILGGTIVAVVSMLLLGFTRSVASVFTGWNNSANDILTIWLAILAIYVADFSINAVQTSNRALLVDTLPSSEQAVGNAWTARMIGIGSVLGFFVGNMDLPEVMPFFGDSQLKVLSVVLSIILLSAHFLVCTCVKERVLLKNAGEKSSRKSIYAELRDIWVNMRTLPRVIRQICLIQLFSWIAWFPILFYSTLYVGEIHRKNSPPPTSPQDRERLDTEATRLGSRALFYSAVISLLFSLILPAFVPAPISATHTRDPGPAASWKRLFAVPTRFQVHVSTMWSISQILLAGCMFAPFFTDTVWGATLIIAASGFPVTLTGWAPHALLAQAILTEPVTQSSNIPVVLNAHSPVPLDTPQTNVDSERVVLLAGDVLDDHDDHMEQPMDELHHGLLARQTHSGDTDYETAEVFPTPNGRRESRHRDNGTLSSKAGIILGIHNTFIVIPQFIVTALSAILFTLLDGDKSSLPSDGSPEVEHHSNSLVYIFCIGGFSATYAFVLSWRLSRDLRHRY
ncbi:major facilitator superfamily domain-containing protein [Panaeolus papilionaceus]|nr:major facilitator superfamily domain-containing protein [Panaeolus papilionaceus]